MAMNQQSVKDFLPPTFLFIILNAGFIIFSGRLEEWGFDVKVLLIGNIILFFITSVSYTMGVKGLQSGSHHAFFRLIYGSFLLKLLLLAGAALAYIMTVRSDVNKPALIFCAVLYVLYTFAEVRTLVRLARKKV